MLSTVAVGFDGSEPSLIALHWALEAAATRESDLLVVIAKPSAVDRSRESARSVERRNRQIDDHIAEVRQVIADTVGGAVVHIEVLEGTPTQVLLAVSGRVELLVVGGHGYSGWRDSFTHSVSGELAVHTRAALCVVRTIQQPVCRRIVVGHDGTANGAAVHFAVAEASRRGASALVVTTWQYPRGTTPTSPETGELLAQGAAAALTAVVADVRGKFPGVRIDTAVRLGHPVEVLAALASTADMVVVGSHGHGGFRHGGFRHGGFRHGGFRHGGSRHGGFATLVVGSVAIGLLRRVNWPVVIVPHG